MKRAFLLLIIFITGVGAMQAQDINPPVLHNVNIYPNSVGVGDTVYVELNITDDISGVNISLLNVGLKAVKNNGSIDLNFQEHPTHWVNTAGNLYVGRLIIDVNWQLDSLYMQWAILHDNAGNYTNEHSTQYPQGHYMNTGIDVVTPVLPVDNTPPVLDSIWIEDSLYNAFDTVKVKILASDNSGSSVYSSNVSFMSPSGIEPSSTWKTTNAYRVGDTLVVKVIVPKYGNNGVWQVSRTTLHDATGNMRTFYSPNDFTANFDVINMIEDSEPPKLLSIDILPDTLHRGDSASIIVVVQDTISGLLLGSPTQKSIFMIFENPYDQQSIPMMPTREIVEDSLYEFRFAISEFAADGVWALSTFTMIDSANNYVDTSSISIINNTYFVVIPDSQVIIQGNIRTSSGAPLRNSRVYTVKFTPADSLLISNRATYTDSMGNYQFISEQRDSLVFIKAIPNDTLYPNEIPTYLDSSWLISQARQLNIDSATTLVDTFATLPGVNTGGHGFITGFIYQGAGKMGGGAAMANLPLILVDSLDRPVAFAITDSTGKYEFHNAPEGELRLFADWIAIQNNLAPVIAVGPNASITDVNFKVENGRLLRVNTSVEEPVIDELILYPNPNSGSFYLKLSSEKMGVETNIRIYDLQGSLWKELTILPSTPVFIDMENATEGVYTLQVISSGEWRNLRFQIMR